MQFGFELSLILFLVAAALGFVAAFLCLALGIIGVRQCDRCHRLIKRRGAVFCSKCGGVLQWPKPQQAA